VAESSRNHADWSSADVALIHLIQLNCFQPLSQGFTAFELIRIDSERFGGVFGGIQRKPGNQLVAKISFAGS
jgi:hypothetical protein